MSLTLWTIKVPATTCSCWSLRTKVMSTGSNMFGKPCFFSSISLITWLVSRPPPSPAKPADPFEPFFGIPFSSLSFANLSFLSSPVSAYFLLNSLLTILFYLSFRSFSFLYSLIIFRFMSKLSSSSILFSFLNSSVRCDINADMFLSGLNWRLLPIAIRQSGHSFFPCRLYVSMQTRLVDDRVSDHLLTDWASKILHHTSNEVSTDLVV